MLVRAKKCKMCGHITGLANTVCEECDSTDLMIIEYSPSPGDEPSWTVMARKIVDSTEVAFQWEGALIATLDEFEQYHDAHDLEFIRIEEDGKVTNKVGNMTVYWVFGIIDSIRVAELVQRLVSLRSGLMGDAEIEVEFHDSVEV